MSNEVVKLKRGQRPEGWKNDCPKFKEYYAKQNPSWTEEECMNAAKKFCRSINWQCIEYYHAKYPDKTLEECEQLRLAAIEERKSNSELNIEYYIKRYPDKTLEECEEMQKRYNNKNCPQRIEYYIKRYPDKTLEECEKMLNNTKMGVIEKHRSYKGENNPNHKSKTSNFERRSRSPKCIEFYQVKYPNTTTEEHNNMLKKHLNNVTEILHDKTKQPKCVEYWLAKGYSKKEAKELISKSQKTFSLEKCVEKYGLEKGTQIFNDRQEKWLTSLKSSMKNNFVNGIQTSNIADDFFNKIELNISGIREFIVGKYAYDFCHNKKIIEFNGDYWHMNPKIYNKNQINKTIGCTAKQIWDNDKTKRKFIEKEGYKVYVVWESDYRNNPNKTIKKCIEFLTS